MERGRKAFGLASSPTKPKSAPTPDANQRKISSFFAQARTISTPNGLVAKRPENAKQTGGDQEKEAQTEQPQTGLKRKFEKEKNEASVEMKKRKLSREINKDNNEKEEKEETKAYCEEEGTNDNDEKGTRKMIIRNDNEREKPETYPQKKPQVADMVKQAREKRRLLTRMASVPAQIQKPVRQRTSSSRLCREHTNNNGQVLQVRQGDITEEVVDVIVNAANSHLAHGGGVAGAIMRAGGGHIQVESDRWIKRNGPVPKGGIAVTGPGRLPSKCIVHAVGPVCFSSEDMAEKDAELRSTVWNSFVKSSEMGMSSISMPAISSGIFGYPKPRCARVLFAAALKFFAEHPDSPLKEIRFTNYDRETVVVFQAEFDRLLEQVNTNENEHGDKKKKAQDTNSDEEDEKGEKEKGEEEEEKEEEEKKKEVEETGEEHEKEKEKEQAEEEEGEA